MTFSNCGGRIFYLKFFEFLEFNLNWIIFAVSMPFNISQLFELNLMRGDNMTSPKLLLGNIQYFFSIHKTLRQCWRNYEAHNALLKQVCA